MAPTDQPSEKPSTKYGTRKVAEMSEADLARLVDDRISKALGLAPGEVEDLPAETGLMATPSVLSTVRATAAAMC